MVLHFLLFLNSHSNGHHHCYYCWPGSVPAASPGSLAPVTEGGPSYAHFIDLKTEVGEQLYSWSTEAPGSEPGSLSWKEIHP